MFEHAWLIVLRGRMLRGQRPGYLLALLSHRHLRYASGLLHLILLGSSIALLGHGTVYAVFLGLQLGLLAAALAGVGIARYYVLITLGDGRRALELPPARRAGDVGAAARGARVNRAADVAIAGSALVARFAAPRARRPRGQARGRRPGALPADARGQGRRPTSSCSSCGRWSSAPRRWAPGLSVNRGDARITRTGRLLRKLSLDELPQLWNVVRGEMSVIGPRPTLRYQVEQYDERQRHRLDVKPGITGWAQVNGRAALPWADRIELDVWYVEHRSPLLDLRILARTPVALFRGTYKGETGGWKPES